jgi:hypothetical protein
LKILATSTYAAIAIILAGNAHAEMCDYKPSNLIGGAATALGATITGGSAAAGVGMQAAGYYTLVHAGSGLTMLGSTAAGASAAGTVGIIAGSSGIAGTVGAILMAPATIVVGGIAIIGVGAFEGACYFQVERITDPYEVRRVVESVASADAAITIVPTDDGDAMALKVMGQTQTYLLRNLYIADGQLLNRNFGPNTNIGPILYTSEAITE